MYFKKTLTNKPFLWFQVSRMFWVLRISWLFWGMRSLLLISKTKFNRKSILIIVQRDATQSSLFIILHVHSTCFICQPHPLSGVHKTVTTAYGTGHIFRAVTSLQSAQASSLYMFQASTTPIIRSTQNCNYSLRYWSYFLCYLGHIGGR